MALNKETEQMLELFDKVSVEVQKLCQASNKLANEISELHKFLTSEAKSKIDKKTAAVTKINLGWLVEDLHQKTEKVLCSLFGDFFVISNSVDIKAQEKPKLPAQFYSLSKEQIKEMLKMLEK